MKQDFIYDEAFSRNLGWVKREEMQILKKATVCIAGLGGAGGGQLIAFTRLGVENFRIADFDRFELVNFNRQEGANTSTIGRSKIEVMTERVKLINPNAKISQFADGINAENLHDFLSGADLFIDGMDAFEIEIRRDLFRECYRQNIPATTVGPIGMGGALMNFLPGKMSFEEYFGFEGKSEEEKFLRLILGITPSFAQLKSLVDRSSTDIKNRRAPSTPMGCLFSAGIAATEGLKILLKRGPISCAPTSVHFDAYTNRTYTRTLRFGHRNPIFQMKLAIMRRKFR